MKRYTKQCVFLFSLMLVSSPLFAQGISTNLTNDEDRWADKINSLMDQSESSEKKAPALNQIKEILLNEFRNNMLLPSASDKNRTDDWRKVKFVRLIKITIDVEKKSGNHKILDEILTKLIEKIFAVREDKMKINLSPDKFEGMKDIFKGMDKKLREAVFEVNNPEVTDKIFTGFYFRLIKIDRFFSFIYEYEDQRPYENFIDQLDKERLEASFEVLQKFLAGLDFINAENQLTRLLLYYYERLGENIWESPYIIQSKNINIAVFIHVLKKHMGRLKKSYEYEAILKKLLEHIDDKQFLIKEVRKENYTYNSSLLDFDFLYHNLLFPAEVKQSPFMDNDGDLILFNDLIDAKNKIILDSQDGIASRGKVDGDLRKIFCNKLINIKNSQILDSQTQTADNISSETLRRQWQKQILKAVSIAIFLPNALHNNATSSLDVYNKLKLELFLELRKNLHAAKDSQLIAENLKSVLRLNKSYRIGDMQQPFYIISNNTYNVYYNRLKDSDKTKIIIEKLKLGISTNRVTDKDNFNMYLRDIRSIINDLKKIYAIDSPNINTQADKVKFYQSFKNVPHEKTIFLLIQNLRNLLNILNNEKYLTLDEVENAFSSINSIIDIYNHYLLFLENFDISDNNKNTLLFMSLLSKDDIRNLFVILLRSFKGLPQDKSVTRLRNKIILKLIKHHFSICGTIFHAVGEGKYEIFNVEKNIQYNLLNFDLLAPIIETGRIGTKTIMEDAFRGFSLNLDLLTDLDEKFIYRYLFSNMDSLQQNKPVFNNHNGWEINCFDDTIKKALRAGMLNSPTAVKSGIDRFVLEQSESFSEVYKRIGSIFGIQKIWEMILANVVNEESNRDRVFFEKYQSFYLNGNFVISKNAEFRKDILNVFKRKFFFFADKERTLKKRLSDYFKLYNGEIGGNIGLKGVLDRYGSSNILYVETYKNAMLDLLMKIIKGHGLKSGKRYIGQMFYDNQQDNIKLIADSDLFSNDFYSMYEWIWESANELADYPELRRIFVEDDIWNKYVSLR